jgi:SAM-dependent methyltransferase
MISDERLMTIPDWQLPPGVDRGLWDYLHSSEMAAGYDAQMAASPLAAFDVRYCEEWFPCPGRLIDLGCGTGRLAIHFARKGYDCVGVDLSDTMLAQAKVNADAAGVRVEWRPGNLVEFADVPDASFDFAACLFSTLGMVRGEAERRCVVANTHRVLRPGGRFVLHVHNRWFHRLGWRRFRHADLTMPQAYGGAPLTLHHFSRREAVGMLESAGFQILDIRPLGDAGQLPAAWWLPAQRAYGYLLAAIRTD